VTQAERIVYATFMGDTYHVDRFCPRNAARVIPGRESDALKLGLRPCKRCAGRRGS